MLLKTKVIAKGSIITELDFKKPVIWDNILTVIRTVSFVDDDLS